MKRVALLISCLAPVVALPAAADTFLVTPDGSGDFPTIQAAITACVDGDVIELADGVFTGDGNRDMSYEGKALTIRSQSGDSTSCIIHCQGGPPVGHRAFNFMSGEGPDSRLERVTITNGAMFGAGVNGGAVAIWVDTSSSPTLEGCVFQDNFAAYGGGAVSVGSSCAPTLIGCVFQENSTMTTGGAVFVGTSGAASIVDCVFERNVSENGGALGVGEPNASADIVNCLFKDNDADYGGAVVVWAAGSHIDVSICTFAGNISHDNTRAGTALMVYDQASATVTGCVLYGNRGGMGTLVTWQGADAAIDGCTFADNDENAVRIRDATGVVHNTIIASNTGYSVLGSVSELTCTCIFGNLFDFEGTQVEDQEGINGNFREDPLFFYDEEEDPRTYALIWGSPCLPGNHPQGADCGLIGANDQLIGVPDVAITPRLFTAAPNPFHRSVDFAFGDWPSGTRTLTIFGGTGRVVWHGQLPGSQNALTWDGVDLGGRQVPAGVYFVRLQGGMRIETRRLVLVR